MKQQDETNQKEIKKLSQKITELNNENRNLVLQLEEMKRQEKEKIDNIENITKNLNRKLLFNFQSRKKRRKLLKKL